tara:strand:- start:719 stop:1027 length:309 start_codon:yes stop_codon:yes gene_type:complete
MNKSNLYNILSKKTELKTCLYLNRHKLKLIQKYKLKKNVQLKLNSTQKQLLYNESQIKLQTHLMEILYKDFIEYETLDKSCWDLTKILDKYNSIKQQIDHLF